MKVINVMTFKMPMDKIRSKFLENNTIQGPGTISELESILTKYKFCIVEFKPIWIAIVHMRICWKNTEMQCIEIKMSILMLMYSVSFVTICYS